MGRSVYAPNHVMRRGFDQYFARLQPSPPGSRNGYWLAVCPKHGEQQHLSALGGRCVKCQAEGLETKDKAACPA